MHVQVLSRQALGQEEDLLLKLFDYFTPIPLTAKNNL